MRFSSLPCTLVALLFTCPVLAALTTRNDPFRTIALKQPKCGQEPVCCLISPPLTESQPTEEELLLSFEEWKAKLSAHNPSSATGSSGDIDSARRMPGMDYNQPADGSENGVHDGRGRESKDDRTDSSLVPNSVPGAPGQPLLQDQDEFGFGEPMLPHFRVPLTDRFNYASTDCSARIHKAHKSAKSASSILSSKKDRYMLSPCATKTADGKEEKHFVIVELCDDIRIDTVQLANFEFFSGVFKEFTVSVAKTYTPDVPEWTTMGTYRARNIRGVQSFHPPTSFRDFYRYIRVDFHSHYGSEFYCPVSLLRVYGLTHLEEWKWNSRAERYEQFQIPAEVPLQDANPSSASHLTPVEVVVETVHTQTADLPAEPPLEPVRTGIHADTQPPVDTSAPDLEPTSSPEDARVDESPAPLANAEPISVTSASSVASHSQPDTSRSKSVPTSQTTEVITSVTVRPSPPAQPSHATPVISLSPQALIPPPHAGANGGESIYLTIMNRIAKLEHNATLRARYVEEHTVGVREVLKRLTEEVGRLEGIGKAKAQMYQRSLQEIERHQKRLELEHGELMSRVQYLAEEITMEKRLGIAQLCIMVAVLVFMALTRGSRGESMDHALLPRLSRSSRTTSLSGEWAHRLRTGSNPTLPTQSLDGGIARGKAALENQKIGSSSSVTPTLDRVDRMQHWGQNGSQTAPNSLKKSSSRARTPQTRTSRVVRTSTTTLPSLRSHITRVNSHSHGVNLMSQSVSSSVITPGPRSAKRWARTAHVHEIKRMNGDSGVSSQSEAEIETPNDSSSKVGWSNKGKQKEVEGVEHGSLIVGAKYPRRGSFGRSPLRPTSSTNVNVLDAEVTDSWVDTDDGSSSEPDVYLNRAKERFTRSADTLTIHHHPSPGLVGVGAS
ncbi:UNC-like C-terminal-domain-containing protein [Thelephora terrestris]|uniref:UNC-like C-terminal-domain-containing protein n=1 Tax=Thelephora terrestris TaxID=56493 RepID=A0A9P6H988_9AGAM|nr:UNC-like C-terminal-domain-containing protein [Thelephora terrestris]